MSFVKLNPEKSYLNIENTGTSDVRISKISTENVRPGQLIILDKYNLKHATDDLGKIFIISQLNPDPEDDEIGNIRIPKQSSVQEIGNNGYDEVELKYLRKFEETIDSGELFKITKTVITLIFDGEMWNVMNINNNVHWETETTTT